MGRMETTRPAIPRSVWYIVGGTVCAGILALVYMLVFEVWPLARELGRWFN
jgi:hypothetical protein